MKAISLFSAAVGALLFASAPVQADPGHAIHPRPAHTCTVHEVAGHYAMRTQEVHVPAGYVWEERTVAVPGRWEIVQEQVTVPGRWEEQTRRVQVRAGYYVDSPDCECRKVIARASLAGGRIKLSLGGHTCERVWIEPIYDRRAERVWVPARVETKAVRKWVPPTTKVERVRVWKPARSEAQQVRVWVPARQVTCCEAKTSPRWSVEVGPARVTVGGHGHREVEVGPARVTIGRDRHDDRGSRHGVQKRTAVERRAARLERERERRERRGR